LTFINVKLRLLYTAKLQQNQFAEVMTVKMVKCYSSSYESHLRATERHPPYGITQCYLPPDTGERAQP